MSADFPQTVFQIAGGFRASKVLFSAVELGVFQQLADGFMSGPQLATECGVHPRGAEDFFDALVALGLLERTDGRYHNTPETGTYLVPGRPGYIGGILLMTSQRLYPFWGRLTEALRSGRPQNESLEDADEDFFGTLYADPQRLQGFLAAMTGVSRAAGAALAEKLPWKDYKSALDVGCAEGAVPVALAAAHPHLDVKGLDLPQVRPHFERFVAGHGLQERVKFRGANFLEDPLPKSDVIVMGRVLHDWGLEDKKMLIRKAHAALPPGGLLVVYEALIDDDRREPPGLLMSLTMLIETPEGFDFTGAQGKAWLEEAGFRDVRVERLVGADSMIVGYK